MFLCIQVPLLPKPAAYTGLVESGHWSLACLIIWPLPGYRVGETVHHMIVCLNPAEPLMSPTAVGHSEVKSKNGTGAGGLRGALLPPGLPDQLAFLASGPRGAVWGPMPAPLAYHLEPIMNASRIRSA